MKRFTGAINRCLETENWYGAIILSLIMPDICGRIAYPTMNTGQRYRKWFNDYLSGPYEGFMTASDCYALRCAMLHIGTGDVTEQNARDTLGRFLFSTRPAHRIKIDDRLVLNVARFCGEVVHAIEEWSKEIEGKADAQEAIQEFLTVHSEGFSPSYGIRIE